MRYWNVAEKVYLRRKDQPRTYTLNKKGRANFARKGGL